MTTKKSRRMHTQYTPKSDRDFESRINDLLNIRLQNENITSMSSCLKNEIDYLLENTGYSKIDNNLRRRINREGTIDLFGYSDLISGGKNPFYTRIEDNTKYHKFHDEYLNLKNNHPTHIIDMEIALGSGCLITMLLVSLGEQIFPQLSSPAFYLSSIAASFTAMGSIKYVLSKNYDKKCQKMYHDLPSVVLQGRQAVKAALYLEKKKTMNHGA